MMRQRLLVVLVLLAVSTFGFGVAGAYGWAEYHLWKARVATGRQDFSGAYSHLSQALRILPHSASTHLLAARSARRAGFLAEAKQHLDTYQRLQGGVSDAARLERYLLRAQDGEAALVANDLWRYLEDNPPEKALILEALVQGYMRAPRPDNGLTALTKLLQAEPDNVWGLYWRGTVHERFGNDEEAVADYRHVLALQPGHAEARKHLADMLIRNDAREALSHLERLRQDQPRDPELLLSLARCWKVLGHPDEAAEFLDGLLADQPEHVGALVERGVLAVQNGAAAEGEKWLRKAIILEPANEDAQYQLYQCLVQQPKREEEAREQLAEWKRVQADLTRLSEIATGKMEQLARDPALMYEVGTLLLRSKQEDKALRVFYGALELQPDYQPVHRALIDYYEAKGRKDLAEQHRQHLPASGKP